MARIANLARLFTQKAFRQTHAERGTVRPIMRMTDRRVLDLLVARFPSLEDAAEALGLESIQFFYNWRSRGVPRGWRLAVFEMCRRRHVAINKNWCTRVKSPEERASLDKSLRLVVARKTNGGTNGKAEGKRKTERPPTAERRSTGGRDIPAPPR